MKRIALILFLLMFAASCSGPLGFLTGGGPNIAANTQAGQQNNQTLGTSEVIEQRVQAETVRVVEQSTGETSVRTERVETVTVNQMDKWTLGLLMLFAGFVIPSPAEIGRWIAGLFRRQST